MARGRNWFFPHSWFSFCRRHDLFFPVSLLMRPLGNEYSFKLTTFIPEWGRLVVVMGNNGKSSLLCYESLYTRSFPLGVYHGCPSENHEKNEKIPVHIPYTSVLLTVHRKLFFQIKFFFGRGNMLVRWAVLLWHWRGRTLQVKRLRGIVGILLV